ncbi:MAG: fused response regulator/phosphatase [Spirochaetes bacterium]|nr:fused response regulator/phosphatase [Spirochaetota bacterium]
MKKKIMVIDDEEPIRRLLSRILSGSGYDVVMASNGQEALERLENVSVDLIMLDMNMPKMDGLSFLRKVKESDITHVPVLMVSGEANPENIVESYKLGVYDFIRKPEQKEVMLKRVENGLKIGEMINFNEFIRVELLMARKLQKYLFPEPSMHTDRVKIHTWSMPLSDIGGDLYDYVIFRDDRIIFFVADVSGHSISASLYTAIVKMVFRNALQKAADPGDLLTIMNRELSGNLPIESFVTAFCGLFDPVKRQLLYSNGGHPKPYCLIDDEIIQLEGNDSFLGPIVDAKYATHTLDLRKGASVLAYTDGILDLMSDEDKLVGQKMLLDVLHTRGKSPLDKFRMIQKYVTGPDVAVVDDCTLMLMDFQ